MSQARPAASSLVAWDHLIVFHPSVLKVVPFPFHSDFLPLDFIGPCIFHSVKQEEKGCCPRNMISTGIDFYDHKLDISETERVLFKLLIFPDFPISAINT